MGRVRFFLGHSLRSDRRPRSRLPLYRRPFADPAVFRRWLVAAALALVAASTTSHLVSGAAAARHRWGDTRRVIVARVPIPPGATLAGATKAAQWPIGLIPQGTLSHMPSNARSAEPLAPGMPLTKTALAGGGQGVGGRKRVAVTTGTARLPLSPGDRVDIWATVDPSLAEAELTTKRIAAAALVTSAGPTTVVVAVQPAEVSGVAEAVALATVTLVASG